MENEVEFKAWPKIPRGSGEHLVVTEKIDGTNSCVIVQGGEVVGTQSRKRMISPGDDNYGFAAWVETHKEEFAAMGDGYTYGEWAGPGINGNNHALEEKTLFLFNTDRWGPHNPNTPKCCKVVPIIFEGDELDIETLMSDLKKSATTYEPEGLVVYSRNTRSYVKYTFKFANGKWAG